MTTMFNHQSKKFFVGAFAIATMALANVCLAGGCTEPGCVTLGTAISYEKTDDGNDAIRISGPKEEVVIDLARFKREEIAKANLLATLESYNEDNNEAILVLKPNQRKVGYSGFTKLLELEGDFDTIAQKAFELEEKGYKVIDFDGFGYEPHPKAKVLIAKAIVPKE